MNDTLTLKPLVKANITGSVLGTASDFARIVVAARNEYHRRSDTTVLFTGDNTRIVRIAHQPPTGTQTKQRSVIGTLDKMRRHGESGELLTTDECAINSQITFGPGTTLVEFERAMMLHLGVLFSTYEAVYRGEA